VMLKYGESLFLDDRRVEELEQELNTQFLVAQGIAGLIDRCINPS
jgi:NifB/MoaA-like Fe-S oxidoreductase